MSLAVAWEGYGQTVTYLMQDGNFPTQFNDGGDFFNPDGVRLGMWANSGNKNTVAWRTFKTAGDNTGSNRNLQIGDVFKITVAATRAFGQIGFSLNAGGAQGSSYANRINGSRLYFNTDNYAAWYVNRNGGNFSLSYVPIQNTYKDYIFTIRITSQTTADVFLTVDGIDYRAYNLTMNGTAGVNIDAFSVYGSDMWDGSSNDDAFWKQTSTVESTGRVELGYFLASGTYNPGIVANGLDANNISNIKVNDVFIGGDAGSAVILDETSNYTGATTINANATARASIAAAFGTTAGGVTVTSGGMLELSGTTNVGAEALSLSGTGISSAGALRNTANNNSWSGAITLGAASRINSDAALLTLSGGIGGAAQNLTVGGAGNVTISGAIATTTGTLTKDGAGTLTLSGVNTYTGTTTITAGTLQLGTADDRISNSSNMVLNGGTFRTGSGAGFTETVGTLALAATSTIALGTGGHTLTFGNSNGVSWAGNQLIITGWTGGYDGTASASAGRIFIGSGTTNNLTAGQLAKISFFNGTNYFTATQLGSGEVVPTATIQSIYWGGTGAESWTTDAKWSLTDGGPFTSNWMSGYMATFNVANSTITMATISVPAITANENVTVTAGGTFQTNGTQIPITVASGKLFNFQGQPISTAAGTGIIKNGAGTLRLNNSNAYTGGFTLNAGMVVAGHDNALGNGLTHILTLNGGTIAGVTADRNFSGDFGGGINVFGDFTLGSSLSPAESNRSLTFSNTVSLGSSSTRTITLGGTGTYTFSGAIGGAGSNLVVGATAAGTLVLGGANTYNGTTTINGGTVFLNGSSNATPGITVASGATLAGSGTATGTLSLSGTVSPGATSGSVGTLATGALTLNNSAGYTFNITDVAGTPGTNWDLLNVSGAINCNASSGSPVTIFLTGNPTGFANCTAYAWTLASGTSVTGFAANEFSVNTAGFTPPFTGTFSIAQNGNNLQLVYTPVPVTPAVSIAVSSGTNPSCSNNNIGFLATATNTGGGTVTYTFFKNAVQVQTGASATLTAALYAHNDVVTCDISISGGTCLAATTASSTGITLTINPVHTISPSSGGTQNACLNTAITNIDFTLGGGATGAGASGLPGGVTGNVSGNTYTLSGSPTATGTFNYTITTTGNGCATAAATGTLVVAAGVWTGAVDNNWHVAGNWCGGVPGASTAVTIPNGAPRYPTISTNNTLAASVTIASSASLTFASGGNLTLSASGGFTNAGTVTMTAGGTLNMGTSSTLANGSATFTGGTGTVVFAGAGSVTGTISFNNLTVNGAVALSNAVTIGGDLQLNTSGSVTTNSPIYTSTSKLIYNQGGTPPLSFEWLTGDGSSIGTGLPQNVTIQNSTAIALPNTIRGLAGNLSILSGSLTASGTINIDFYIGGNWTRVSTATFTPGSRAVRFIGSGTQVIEITGGGTASFNSMIISKSGGNVQLDNSPATNLLITGSGTPLTLANGGLDLNGQTCTMNNGTSGVISLVSGARTISSSIPGGVFEVSGAAKTLSNPGTLVFDANTILRLFGGFNPGSSVTTINGRLDIRNGGFVQTNNPTYGDGSILSYNSGGVDYGIFNEWGTGTSGPGVPFHVAIGDLVANAGMNFGARNGTSTCRGNFTISGAQTGSFATLSTNANGHLQVGGDFTNGGTLTHNSKTITLNGSGTQTLSGTLNGTGTTNLIPSLTINKTGGAVTLAAPVNVTGTVTLTSSTLINTDATNILRLTNTAVGAFTGAGIGNSGYVNGPLARDILNSITYVFNTGATGATNGPYLPFTLTAAASGNSGMVTVEAKNGGTGGTVDGTTVTALSGGEYWTLSGSNINGTVSLGRQQAVSPNNIIARSSSLGGLYANLGGSASGNNITVSNNTSGSGFFTMAQGMVPPTITSVVPNTPTYTGQANNTGYIGQTLFINGANFTGNGTMSVTIGGVAAASFNVESSILITAVVPVTAANGNVTVTNTSLGLSASLAGFVALGYVTKANGDWNTPGTWLGDNIPPASATATLAHDNTVNATVANNPNIVTVLSGGKLTLGASGILGVNNTFTNAGTVDMSAAGTLNMGAGSTFANGTATFTGTAGFIIFNGTGTITGTITLPIAIANGAGISFPATATIGGAFQINTGGFATGTVVYGAGSTLIYNASSFTVSATEWGVGSATNGNVPYNVQVGGGYGTPVNTSLAFPNSANFRHIRGNLVIFANSSFTLNTSNVANNLLLEGSLTNNGTFSTGARSVTFTGGGNSNINIGSSSFTNLIINKTPGGSATLTANASISSTLAMTEGILHTNGFSLAFTSTAAANVSGGSSTSFINGSFSRTFPNGNNANTYLFPVGSGTTYLPFSINSTTTAASLPVITVTAVGSAPSGTADGSTLQSLSGSEYWTATFTGTFVNMTVSLGRQSPLGSLNKIGRSSSTNGSGTFSTLGGTVSGTNINISNVTGNTLGSFAMAVGMPDPVITNVQHVSLTPAVAGQAANSGYVGQTLTITGSNYITGFTSVNIGGTAASSFSVVDANTITAMVAAGAANGNVVVTNTATTGAGTFAGFTALGYITGATGTWGTNGTWLNNSVPPSNTTTNITINHDVTGTSGTAATGSLTVIAGKTLTISNGSTIAVNTGSTNSGTIDVWGNLANAATYTNNGSLNILNGGNLQINQGGFYNGTAPVYNTTASSLTFNNSSGQYGIATTHVYWPASNGPVTVVLFGAGGAQMQAGVSRTVANLTLHSALDVQTAGGITVTGTLKINATAGAVTSNAPVYSSTNATLSYNSGNTSGMPYAVGLEWSGNSLNPGTGIPYHVKVGDPINTFITMPNGNRGFGGDFTLEAGSGITLNGTAGDLHVGGHFTNNATTNFNSNNREVIFNGTGNQGFTGTTTFTYLRINKPSGSLNLTGSNTSSITVNNRLAMPLGNIILGDNNLTLASGAALEGVGNGTSVTSFSAANMVITGLAANANGFFRRTAIAGGVNLLWPIAESNDASEYSPVTMIGTISTGGTVGYKVTDGVHPNNGSSAEYLTRYWTISTTAGAATGMDIRAYYQASGDLVGTESNLRANVYFSALSGWLEDPASTVGGATYPLQIRMVLDNTTTGLTTNDISARKEVPTLYRTITGGPWNNTGTWEVSIDGGAYGTPAAAPTALNSTSIIIRHTVSTSGAISLDQTTIQSGGVLNFSAGTIMVFNGTGEDLVIENGGVFRHSFNSAIPTLFNVPTWRVKTGGMIHVNTNSPGSQADAYASDELATYAASMIWENGSIFHWQSTNTLSSSGRTYFVNAGSDQGIIPIFRFSSSPSLAIGAATNTVINGLLEANAAVTFQNAGSKIFRNGIIGSGTVTQSSSSGVFIINGSTSQLGGGVLNLNTTVGGTDGLQIPNGTCTLISNKVINTTNAETIKLTTSDATFNAQGFALSGSAGFEHTTNSSTFITSHANGVDGSLGGLTGIVSFANKVNYTFTGSGNQVTGTKMGKIAGNIVIDKINDADIVTVTNDRHSATTIHLYKGLLGIGTGRYLTMGDSTKTASNANALYGKGYTPAYNGSFVLGDGGGTLVATGYTTVHGSADFQLWQVEAYNNETPSGLQFTDGNPTIKNYLKIMANGFVGFNSPRYAEGSTLIYANSGTYNRNTEWGNTKVANNPGYPWHVKVENNTTLYLSYEPIFPTTLPIAGDLVLGTNFGKGIVEMVNGGHTAKALEVAGSVIIGGYGSPAGSTLTLGERIGEDLILGGDFIRYSGAIFDDRNRAVFLKGVSNAKIETPGETGSVDNPSQYFSYVYVDKDNISPVPQITLQCPVGITQLINFNNGIITTTASKILSIRTAATATGGNDNSFVNGPMTKRTNNSGGNASIDFTFPIGKNGSKREYRPAKIAELVHDGTNITTYTAEYFQTGSTGSGAWQDHENFTDARLIGVYKNQYWMINNSPAKTGVGGRIGLYYRRSLDEFYPVAFRSTSAVAPVKFYGPGPGNGSWEYTVVGKLEMDLGPYFEAIGGNTTNFEWVYTEFLDAFSPFTIGFGDNRVLPLSLLSFTATLHGPDALLHWTLADAKDLKQFVVEHSNDGQVFTRLATVGHNGSTDYNYRHAGLQPGVHYYRLKMVEKNGRSGYSKVEVLMVNTNRTLITGLMQNPIQGGRAVLKVYSATNQDAEAVVLDMAGRMLLRQKLSLQTGYNQPSLSLLLLPSGMYKMLIRTGDGVEKVLTVVK